MQPKIDPDATPGVKLIRLFRKLLVDGRRHFQSDLAKELQCSPQTIIRMMREIETVIGINLETGLKDRRRWYRMIAHPPNKLGLEYEELRYLAVCRDLAVPTLPDQIRKRVDSTIFNLSVLMSEKNFAEQHSEQHFAFYSKGRIDYSPHNKTLETLLKAVQTHKICLLSYRASGKTSALEHRFAPGRLVSMNQAIYVLGAILEEDYVSVRHYTHLAVHRIVNCALLDRLFKGSFPEFEGNTFGIPWHEPREFKIRFAKGRASDYVKERIWADQQSFSEEEDGSLLLTIVTRSEPELLSWVRSFGDQAELLTPLTED
ncbi:MAG: WYL domain-containing protein [Desulfovibrionaceae bacterium]|nr:WYL domain-containing protein [Desulfovibrionaceae bacterium]